jgi:L-histidine N-alpha-methyltransferase
MTRITVPREFREQLVDDVREGLLNDPKSLPSKYFYDKRGSELFEEITSQPEYYLARVETDILERHAPRLMSELQPEEIFEIGSGSSRKTRLLLEAMHDEGSGDRYVPFDVSEDALIDAARRLSGSYPWLEIDAVSGDFHTDLPLVERKGRRLVAFLGSTIGNLRPEEVDAFYRDLARMLRDDDAVLIGYDLIKDTSLLEAAYNDGGGVTAEFNRNILRVVNDQLDADFPLEDFEHVSRYLPERSRIESGLRARRNMNVSISAIDDSISLERGEIIHTEISAKFERQPVERRMGECGLELTHWITDDEEKFALGVARARH